MNIFKQIVLGLVLATQMVSLNATNTTPKPTPKEKKSAFLSYTGAVVFGLGSIAAAHKALATHYVNNFAVGSIANLKTRLLGAVDDATVRPLWDMCNENVLRILGFSVLSYGSLQIAKNCWKKARKIAAEKE